MICGGVAASCDTKQGRWMKVVKPSIDKGTRVRMVFLCVVIDFV